MKKLKEIKIAEVQESNLHTSLMFQEMGHALYEKHFCTDYRVHQNLKKNITQLFILKEGKYYE